MTDAASIIDRQASWASSRETRLIRSRRFAWIVATATLGIGLIEAVAIAYMVPLRTVVPIAVMVDRTTGYIQRVDLDRPERITADEALRRAMIGQYVVARESYDPVTLRDAFRKVTLWSAGPARSAYVGAVGGDRAARRGDRTVAQVKSISFSAPGGVMARFDRVTYAASGQMVLREPRVAVLKYRFTDAAMSAADRLDNPLGFQVTDYSSDAEAPPVALAAEPARDPSPAAPPPVQGPTLPDVEDQR